MVKVVGLGEHEEHNPSLDTLIRIGVALGSEPQAFWRVPSEPQGNPLPPTVLRHGKMVE